MDAKVIGYSNKSKAYRLWKKGTKTVIKSRDVRINEKNILNKQELIDFSTRNNKNESEKDVKDKSLTDNTFSKELHYANNFDDTVEDSNVEINTENDESEDLLPEPLTIKTRAEKAKNNSHRETRTPTKRIPYSEYCHESVH